MIQHQLSVVTSLVCKCLCLSIFHSSVYNFGGEKLRTLAYEEKVCVSSSRRYRNIRSHLEPRLRSLSGQNSISWREHCVFLQLPRSDSILGAIRDGSPKIPFSHVLEVLLYLPQGRLQSIIALFLTIDLVHLPLDASNSPFPTETLRFWKS
jgi:hypothetical protein